jgi:MFS family permease
VILNDSTHRAVWRKPALVLVAGCLIAMIGFGTRSVFGLFLDPMTQAHDWGRESFAMAMAIQNLLWGLGLPVAGALSDRYGATRVMAGGALMYAFGVWGMAEVGSVFWFHIFAGLLTGTAVAFTSFSLAMAAMARAVGPEHRSLALGLGTAAGSVGQIIFSPLAQTFISSHGWNLTLLWLGLGTLLMVPLAFALPRGASKGVPGQNQSLREAISEAMSHPGYVLLTIGFFVCGFHVSFISVHFPAYVVDLGLPAHVGAYALAIVGGFNIIGAVIAGFIGQRVSKCYTLSGIYLFRAVAIAALMLSPATELTIYLFAAGMGLFWLSTVPLTTGMVAQVFGMQYMGTLFGFVFLGHQTGSFLGVWAGGRVYDLTGSYDMMWWAGVALAVFACLVHLPIDERPLARLSAQRS